MTAKPRWTTARREAFLHALADTVNVSASCKLVGMTPSGAYALRRRNAAFAADWDAALETGVDQLEAVVLRRALHGTQKDQFYAGEKIGTVTTYSDTLAMFLLKSRRPDVYGDLKAVTTPDSPEDAEDYEAAYARLMEKLEAIRPAASALARKDA